MVNSHVYIAESILNRFCIRDKDNRKIINYFDFKNNTIASSTTKKFNTSYGYYTEKNESILKSKAEEKIGNIIKMDLCQVFRHIFPRIFINYSRFFWKSCCKY